MPDRDQAIEQIAHHLHKHSPAIEGGYSYVPGKFRWERFLEIATKVYDGVVAPMLAEAERRRDA